MKKSILVVILLTTCSTFAAQVITLDDGRKVQLEDDFTWHYLTNKKPKNDQKAPLEVIPVIKKQVGTTVSIADKKPIMQLSNSGVDVLLGSASYQDGELTIPTSITNQSSHSIILIEVDVVVSDMSGKPIASETFDIWTSIKRMADTYLRPAQAVEGKVIRLAVDEAEEYRISANISEIETR